MGVMVYVQSLSGGSVKSLFCLQESSHPDISIGIFLCQRVNKTQASLPQDFSWPFGHRSLSETDLYILLHG